MNITDFIKKKTDPFIRNKGLLAPLSEIAYRNFELVCDNNEKSGDLSLQAISSIYQFSIGQTFKSHNIKQLFNYQLNDEKDRFVPTKYLSLQKKQFIDNEIASTLLKLVSAIRELNQNYTHNLEPLRIGNNIITPQIIEFLHDLFEVSIIMLLNKSVKDRNNFTSQYNEDSLNLLLKEFILTLFFPETSYTTEEIEVLRKKSKDELINEVLFFDVQSVYQWKVVNNPLMMPIQCGKYLSFTSCLFINSLFLFKEDTKIIFPNFPFLKNKTDETQVLQMFFSLFANPYTLHYIPSQHLRIAKHKDIIEYLNLYPSPWQEALNSQSPCFPMSHLLKDFLIERECNRVFLKVPPSKSNPYSYNYKPINGYKDYRLDSLINNQTDLWSKYSRKQDKFMLYASRYLAESNYFGEEAMFKVYQFASNEEQEKYIVEAKQNLPKREYDKLKYHKGRLVVYKSYHNHLQEYPRWDSPFVVENNAIQIYVKILGEPWIVSIQRRLIIYFLEDALFSKKKESNGIALLQNYLPHHQRDVRNGLFVFKTGQTNNLSTKEMSNLRKLFPRKLIQSYLYEDNTGDMDSPSQVLSDTSINDTEKKGTKKILNLRVGKHLKLRYIRKVWNLIYFKDIYKDQAQRMGHHKKFHITKDEFVFYTRWMYSFESIPSYKDHLIQFFIKKHFFNNEEFKELFLNSSSIDELYLQTKRNFIKWSAHNVNSEKKEKTYSLEDYKLFFESKILYINVSHFISFLNQEKVIQKNDNGIIQYKALKNLSYLIKPFYYKDKLEIEHYKTYGKVFNKLRSIKLEDCLLYEIAYRYLLNVTPSFPKYKQLIIQSFPKEKVDLLVNAIYSFEIHNKKGAFIYSIQVPFLKLNELVCLIYRNSTKIAATNKEFLFLQIYKYLVNYCKNKPVDYELYTVCYKFNQLKVLGYDDLLHFLKHIVKRGLQLTQILTQLEKFLIIKNNIQIDIQKQGTLNSLSIYECSKMNNPQKLEDLRIKAINFDIPDTDYPSILEHIEKQFIIKETPFKPVSWSHLEKHTQDMCDIMMNMLHLNLYKRNSDTESREEAKIQFRDRYFNTVVKQSD